MQYVSGCGDDAVHADARWAQANPRLPLPVSAVPYILALSDVVAIFLGIIGAVPILNLIAVSHLGLGSAAGYAAAVTLCYVLTAAISGFDQGAAHSTRSFRGRPVRTLYVGIIAFAIPLVVPLLVGASRLPFSFMAAAVPMGLGLLLVFRLVFDAVITRLGEAGRLRAQRIILVRATSEPRGLDAIERALAVEGVRTVASVDLPLAGPSGCDPETVSRTLDRVIELAGDRERKVEEIFIVGQSLDGERLGDALTVLSGLPLPVRFLPSASLRRLMRGRVETIGAHRVFELQRQPLNLFERALKRATDIVGASLGLVMLAPLFLTVAVLIKLTSRGPVFFRQDRVGFCGRLFRIYKFRSMLTEDNGPVVVQATRNDPRLTRIGGWLRATSIDELPQLINVLMGDMSLIGPRPHAKAHHEQYLNLVALYGHRHHMKPGITGWAQANGFRGETPTLELMERRVEHDIWYIRNWSIWLDLRTALLTVWTLFASGRAY